MTWARTSTRSVGTAGNGNWLRVYEVQPESARIPVWVFVGCWAGDALGDGRWHLTRKGAEDAAVASARHVMRQLDRALTGLAIDAEIQ